jgi:hypothetical protein
MRHWAAFCAASVEFLCDRYGLACPAWVFEPAYTLTTPWYGDIIVNLTDTVVLERRRETTPTPFCAAECLLWQPTLSEHV